MSNSLAGPSSVPPTPPFSPTLPAAIRHAATAHGDAAFLIADDRKMSFDEVDRQSADLARRLLSLGLGKGARIGLLMPNDIDWIIAWFAAARAGCVTVAISTLYQPPELSWALRHNDIDTLLTVDRYLKIDFADRLERAIPELAALDRSGPFHMRSHPHLRRIVMWGAPSRPWAVRGPEDLPLEPQIDEDFLDAIEAAITPADDLIVISTSGTTAEPKAVIHTHGTAVRTTWAFTELLDIRPGDRTYSGSPFFWIAGLNITVFPSLYVGAALCFSSTPQLPDVLAMVVRDRVTRLSMHSTQVKLLLEAAGEGELATVRTWHDSTRDRENRPIPPDRQRGWMFGMTETFGPHTMEAVNMPAPDGKAGCLGKALPGVERIVVDRETREILPPGERGELFVRGYTLMRGYYKKEREQAFTRDGWFATGDIVSIDADGYMFFHGRGDDAIKTAGANVAPVEVERALERSPDVREAIVFGVPDPKRGQRVIAVVLASEGEIDTAALATRLRDELSPFKIPSDIVQMTDAEIPRTAPGKPIKQRLAAHYLSQTPDGA